MTFYLGSIVISFTFNVLTIFKVVRDISNRGYKLKNTNKKQYLTFFPLCQLSLFGILPIVNLITSTLLTFNTSKLSKICIKSGIKHNILIKKDNIEQVKEIKIDKYSKEEKSEMPREKKLEILREEYRKLTEHQVIDDENQKKIRIGKKRR